MAEKSYGKNKISYVVTKRDVQDKGQIQVFVFHDNENMRNVLKETIPHQLLKRYDAFQRSTIVAENWLAKVMNDYRKYFKTDRVDFIYISFESNPKN